jgi:hypothetical protein
MDGHGFEERGSRRTALREAVQAWQRFDFARWPTLSANGGESVAPQVSAIRL